MLPLVLGCAPPPCEPDAVPVVGEASSEAQQIVREALLDATAWSARPVCVAEVRLEPDLTEDHALQGQVRGTARPVIRLDADLPPAALRAAALHELCHVLDRAHDLSSERPDLFDGQGLPTQYRGAAATRESFARVCEQGPIDPVYRHVVDACAADDARAWVDDRVWSAAEDPFPIRAAAAPQVTPTWTLDTVGEAVPAWLGDEVVVAWPETVDVAGAIGHAVRLEGYDPATGEPLGTWHTPWAPTLAGDRFAWVRGDGLLLLQSVPGGDSWVLDPTLPGVLATSGLPPARWVGAADRPGWVAVDADDPSSGVWRLSPDGTATSTPSALPSDARVGALGWLGDELVVWAAGPDARWTLQRADDGTELAVLPEALESLDLLGSHALGTWDLTTEDGPLTATVWLEPGDPTVAVATPCDASSEPTGWSDPVERADATFADGITAVRVEQWRFPTR